MGINGWTNSARALRHREVSLWYHFMRTELVTTLKRKATRLLDELERTREPMMITQHGLPSA